MPLSPASDLLKCLRGGSELRLISDGGMGSELIRHGISSSRTLHANTNQVDIVRTIHQAYLQAGAEILSANTFGLPEFDDAEKWMAQVTAGLEIAADAAQQCKRNIWVWTPLAPGTAIWALEGNRHSYWPTAHGAGDALLIETCVALPQAVRAIRAVRQSRLLPPSLLAVTCHFDRHGMMPDGSQPEEVARTLTQAGADVVGGNCGDVPEGFLRVAERMRQATDLPLLFQPNAGLPQIRSDSAHNSPFDHESHDSLMYTVGAERFARVGAGLWDAGVTIVGGCCGTTPAHIGALALLRTIP